MKTVEFKVRWSKSEGQFVYDSIPYNANRSGVYVELPEAKAEIARIKGLYKQWGYMDAPCPKHSKPSLLLENCASCRAEKAEAEIAALRENISNLLSQRKEAQGKANEAMLEVAKLRERQRVLVKNILSELHKILGVCGHCGKKKCAERPRNSVLPNALPTDHVLDIINRAALAAKEG